MTGGAGKAATAENAKPVTLTPGDARLIAFPPAFPATGAEVTRRISEVPRADDPVLSA